PRIVYSPSMVTNTSSSGSNAAVQVSEQSDEGPASPYVNLRKQAKYVLIGGFGVWYWQVHLHIQDALQGSQYTRSVALLSIALYVSTILIFAYVILLPARGQQVDYLQWQKDSNLKTAIPALTVCIVAGYVALFFALSPIVAPLPPSPAFSQRLLEAADQAGGNLQKATAGVQLMLSDAARSFDGDALAGRLGVSKEHTTLLMQTLEKYQRRAQAWKENNVSVLGWTGATFGSASAFVFLFGVAGLLGLFTPKPQKNKRAML
ncbi:uncharacterized protein FA14DRAFT_126588, partial [Meira miltonrushii]